MEALGNYFQNTLKHNSILQPEVYLIINYYINSMPIKSRKKYLAVALVLIIIDVSIFSILYD